MFGFSRIPYTYMPSDVRSLSERPRSVNAGYYTRHNYLNKGSRKRMLRRKMTIRTGMTDPNLIYRHRHIMLQKGLHGIGMIATRSIPKGTVIIREKPFFLKDEPLDDHYKYKLIKHMLSNEYTSKAFIDMVPLEIDPEDSRVISYESIRAFHQTYLPELTAHEMRLYFMKYKQNVFSFKEKHGICIYATRINHSCHPNVTYYQDPNAIIYQTTRAIEKNDEIYISYINPEMPGDERRPLLKQRYQFDCLCEKCQSDINPLF